MRSFKKTPKELGAAALPLDQFRKFLFSEAPFTILKTGINPQNMTRFRRPKYAMGENPDAAPDESGRTFRVGRAGFFPEAAGVASVLLKTFPGQQLVA